MSQTLDRLLAKDWNPRYDCPRSFLLLLYEYNRRAALWAEALDHIDQWPFFDIAGCIDPSVRTSEDNVEALYAHLKGKASTWFIKVLEGALHWDALSKELLLPFRKLPEPYAPLITLYERGGELSIEHGFIMINDSYTVQKGNWQDHYRVNPIVTLDKETLDMLDIDYRYIKPLAALSEKVRQYIDEYDLESKAAGHSLDGFLKPQLWVKSDHQDTKYPYLFGLKLMFLANLHTRYIIEEKDTIIGEFVADILGTPPYSDDIFDTWWEVELFHSVYNFDGYERFVSLESFKLLKKKEKGWTIDDWLESVIQQKESEKNTDEQ